MKQLIQTDKAPMAIGCYSQAIESQGVVYISGQIALTPEGELSASDEIEAQLRQVFSNLAAVCQAAHGSLKDIVKLTVYLKNLHDFDALNVVMSRVFSAPYPARAVVEVSRLPKDVLVEVDAIMYVNS